MKRVIREGCFETNSSSLHSIVIKKKDSYYNENSPFAWDCYIDKNGIINVWNDEDIFFERHPFRFLISPYKKALYAIGALSKSIGDDVYKEIIEIMKIAYPNFKDFKFPSYYNDEPTKPYSQDYGRLKNFMNEKNISMKEFILNEKYVVIVDGDEYCIWSDFKNSGLIDLEAIDYEYKF